MSEAAAGTAEIQTEFETYDPGTFCWIDLQTNDPEAAKQFYTELFGLSVEDMPMPDGGNYSMLKKDSREAAAIAPLKAEEANQGIPPHWNSYVCVESAEASTAKAQELGGTVIMEPFDVMDAGRMAVIQDPTGAIILLWQEGKDHSGAAIANVPGTWCWNELLTRDVERAKSFYTQLFGWSANTMDMGEGMQYTSFMDGEKQRGGMMAMPPMVPAEAPPGWMVYFACEDTDATAEKVRSLGGNVLNPPQDIPEVGRFAVLQDPQGAVFSVIKLNNSPA